MIWNGSADKGVLIVGGGAAGLSATIELAERGTPVAVIDSSPRLGGKAARYACKATDECQYCNVCLILEGLETAYGHPNIEVFTSSELTWVRRYEGRIHAGVRRTGESRNPSRDPGGESQDLAFRADALILAVGADLRDDPATVSEYGHGRGPRVLTAYELEQHVRSRPALETLLGDSRRLAFIQCVGSRDVHEGGYCSRVCCGYAMRLARMIRRYMPNVQVDIYYMDLQAAGGASDTLYAECKNDGVRFVRGKPARVECGSEAAQPVSIVYEDIADGRRRKDWADLVVLSIGLKPGNTVESLSRMIGIERDGNGFFATLGEEETGVHTNVPGVFVAGTCAAPCDIREAVAWGRRAAANVTSFLEGRSS